MVCFLGAGVELVAPLPRVGGGVVSARHVSHVLLLLLLVNVTVLLLLLLVHVLLLLLMLRIYLLVFQRLVLLVY